jgi:hypothetical protein
MPIAYYHDLLSRLVPMQNLSLAPADSVVICSLDTGGAALFAGLCKGFYVYTVMHKTANATATADQVACQCLIQRARQHFVFPIVRTF